jgi:enterobactin synthetase component D
MTSHGIEEVAPPLRLGTGAGAAVTVHSIVLLAESHSRLGIPLPLRIAQAVEKRRADYIAGRFCAARALAALGLPDSTAVGRGEDGAPHWPEGIVGSITHTAGFAWAAAAHTTDAWSMGVDSERIMSAETRREVETEVMGAADARRYEAEDVCAALGREVYVTLVFSAKESLLKCLYPVCGTLFAPGDIVVSRVDLNGGTLDATVTAGTFPGSMPRDYRVQFALRQPYVHTALCLTSTALRSGRSLPEPGENAR